MLRAKIKPITCSYCGGVFGSKKVKKEHRCNKILKDRLQ